MKLLTLLWGLYCIFEFNPIVGVILHFEIFETLTLLWGLFCVFEIFNSIVGVNFEHKGSHTVLVLILDILV